MHLSLAPQPDEEQIVLAPDVLAALVDGARDPSPVNGLSHNHYKYPARFSPKFVRAAIEAFSEPGDLIADPFVGGGTTAVEALALGRDCLGVDISSLATFVAQTKTLVLSDAEAASVRAWALKVPKAINMNGPTVFFATGAHEGYYRNIEGKRFWRLRKAIEQALASVLPLQGNAEPIARCAVLRTAQWALDGRAKLPTVSEFRTALQQNAEAIVAGSLQFRAAVELSQRNSTFICLNRTGAGMEEIPEVKALKSPKLVLTSPPYPGIHVLYHRWQVDGRKETPAPFLIANKLDGSGESYYTLGHRHNPGLKTYWANLKKVLSSTVHLSDGRTLFVQVVAFSEPEWQLPRYLEVCGEAGLREVLLPGMDAPDKRLWRVVPNRRWYADQMGSIPASQEVVLFHRLKADPARPLPHRQPNSSLRADLPGF